MAAPTRRTLLAGAAAAALGGLAGCSGTTQASPPPRAGDAVPSTGTLDVWCWDPAFNVYAMKEAAKVYRAKHPGITVNVVETPWDDVQTKITTLALSNEAGKLPDIFLMQNNAFQKNVTNYPELFADLTDSGIRFDQYAASVVNYSTVNGRHHGVPFDNGTAIDALRLDVIDKAGLTIKDFTDTTWDDYLEMGKQVRARTGKPLNSGVAQGNDLIVMMLQSAGASLFTEDGRPDIRDNEALRASIAVYQKLVWAGVMTEVNSWDQYIGSFVNGSVAGTITGAWILGSIQTAKGQSGLWDVTNLPRLSGIDGATNYSANGGSSWAVSSHGHSVLASDFLAETFAGSTAFYETILPSSGALANWLPAGKSPTYRQPQPFFDDQPIYSRIVDYSTKVPANATGVFYYEARDAVGAAITKVLQGASPDEALGEAQAAVEFAMK